ncbi:DUF4870 domain-containing protein [Jeotgalibacillus soli]|uniref:DUF4870 domain-containing protein n=1 Tax=Jeotgalibacillus soli TaxID=889306 RepID=A0A0C2RPF8_9BACL|nr:DUF4870 domain-containing protein [Jeotgalibacillus soli]KIL52150.1 hypothetical protein KP78_05200 [Jeotgalibacillus soli]
MHTPSSQDRLFASLMYFLSFLTAIIAPAIIWFLKRDSDYINYHGKEYTNFVISYFLYQAVAGFLMFIGIGFILTGVLTILMIVFTILAGIKAYQGEKYRIPLVIKFFS